MHPFCYNHLDHRINMCAATIYTTSTHKDIYLILILNFATDYLHFAVADPGGGAGGARPPFQKNNKKLRPIFVQFCS